MYREINIVMNRRWIRKQNAFRMNENDENDEWNENDNNQIANEQIEHTSHVTKMIYARKIMKRNDEMINKRQRFRKINKSWHIFLRFQFVIDNERLLIRKNVQNKRKIISFQTKTKNARFFRWKRLKNMNFQRQLRQMLNENNRFREIQETTIRAIMKKKNSIMTIMNIENDKSLLFMLFALCEFKNINIVMISLIALRKNLKKRCEKIKIRCVEWNNKRSSNVANIVLMTSKSIVDDEFRTFINRLRVIQRLNRIVIDECHIVLNNQWNFRKEMQQLKNMIDVENALMLLIVTLFFNKKKELWQRIYF